MRADTKLSRFLQKTVVAFGPSPDVRISLYYGEAAPWVGFAVEIAKKKPELPAAVTRDDSREPLELSSAAEHYKQERSTAVDGLYNRSMIMLGVRGMRFE
jgi:hypothetical protein